MLGFFVIVSFIPALIAASPQRQGKIIGGSSVAWDPSLPYPSENYPYQVAILRQERSSSCGGSIISIWCVLTAANCEIVERFDWKVIFGSLSITNYDKVKNERFVDRFKKHPNYVNAGQGYDIAIVKVDRAFVFDFNVQPVVIRAIAYPPMTATATGWGQTGGGDESSVPEFLQKVSLNLMSYAECTRKWGILPANVTCASYPGKGTCTGDNGGPLVQRESGPYGGTDFIQIGITSFRANCTDTNLPGVFTSVLDYLDSFILPTTRAFNALQWYF